MAERVVPTRENYPNNSERAKNKVRRERESNEKIEKVTKGTVVQRKKSFGKKFAEAFGAREGQGVIDYILYDIIIPATKNMVVDSIINGAEMAILGEVRGRRGYGSSSPRASYRYDRVSYRGDDRRDYRDRYDDRRPPRGLYDYEDILFEGPHGKEDAEDVISGMIDILDAYGEVTVAALYELAGVTPEYTVGNYGWTNLSSAHSRRVRDGYVLDLPRAIAL